MKNTKKTNLEMKKLAFEYAVIKFIDWEKEITKKEENTIGSLKSMALVFFITMANIKQDKNDTLIKEVFNNFYAMAYGPLENDLYESIRNEKFKYININDEKVTIIGELTDLKREIDLDVKTQREIDLGIENLRQINKNFIQMSLFELLDLSRIYYSWRKTYYEAKQEKLYSKKIDTDLMIREDKIFHKHL